MGASFACGSCGAALAASAGRPHVTATGAVVLLCRVACQPIESLAQVAASVTPRGALPTAVAFGLAALAAGVLAVRGSASAVAAPAAPGSMVAAAIALDDDDALAPAPSTRVVVAPAETPPESALTRGGSGEDEIDVVWYHPLAGARQLPIRADRRFGAGRPGQRPSECGGGHCGVDLGEKVGEVIHAALPGVVRYVKRVDEGRGGRYVVLDHPGGYSTYYFHLDRVHPSLVAGIEIAAGEPIGTLGHSGIQHAEPHLHFQVARRDASGETFLDPEPMLRRAVVLEEPAPMPADDLAPAGASQADAPSDATLPEGE